MPHRAYGIVALTTLMPGCTLPDAPAEVPSHLEVYVRDASTGRSVPGARVILTFKEPVTVLVAGTDHGGVARFPHLAPGEFDLGVRSIGYNRYDSVFASSVHEDPIDISLEPMIVDLVCNLVVTPLSERAP